MHENCQRDLFLKSIYVYIILLIEHSNYVLSEKLGNRVLELTYVVLFIKLKVALTKTSFRKLCLLWWNMISLKCTFYLEILIWGIFWRIKCRYNKVRSNEILLHLFELSKNILQKLWIQGESSLIAGYLPFLICLLPYFFSFKGNTLR